MQMKWEKGGLKSPMARAKGLGSANSGVDHWFSQRVTAIANIPLVIWAIWAVVHNLGASYVEFTTWLSHPLNAILMILFVISTFYHAYLGTQVVTEDYVHNEGFKLAKLIGQKLFFFAIGTASVFAVLKIAFTGI